jgi:site-specific DNA recombinase
VTEWIDTTTPVGKFNFRNLASAAELEREVIGERARMGMHALALQRKWPNKIPPLGYNKRGDGRLKINVKEARIVIRIFQRYLETRSMPKVAHELNREGIKTKRGGKWRTDSIKVTLDNKIYIGEYSVAGYTAYVREYKIIDPELFDMVHRVKEVNKYRRGRTSEERRLATVERVFDDYLEHLCKGSEDATSLILLSPVLPVTLSTAPYWSKLTCFSFKGNNSPILDPES